MRVRGGCSQQSRQRWLVLVAATAAAAATGSPVLASPLCAISDSFQSFMSLAKRTAGLPAEQQVRAFRDDYLARRPELYAPGVMPAPADARALKAMAAVRAHPEWGAFDAALQPALEHVAKRFRRAFPDFRCDFPVYVTETFGAMDGAGRVVAGHPALVLGVDSIAEFETSVSLPVFLSHELFHRYHFQTAGFSDDLGERDLLWRSLWAEGLATYVSALLNPSNSLSDALIFPRDLEAQAKPFVPEMASDLLAAADRVDPATFAEFFEVESLEAKRLGWPARSGYYIGFLVAQDLGRRQSLSTLAHMQGPALRAEIGRSLERLASSASTVEIPKLPRLCENSCP
jgi:hypothetical protein